MTVFIFLFGLIVGSFLNYVIYRLSLENYSFYKDVFNVNNRSYCPHCKHILSWKDLFPVVSFVFLRGKCRYCHKKISWQYPLVELSTAFLFLFIYSSQFSLGDMIFLFYVVSVLIVIFVFDLQHYIIPDKVLFPAIAISFVYRLFPFTVTGISNYVLAVLLASGFFLSIFLISRGTWMGFGDVKLAILLGLILGFPNILVALFLAFFLGAIVGIVIMTMGKKGLKSEVPFAPFLITGTWLALFWGQGIINWYLSFFAF